MQQNEFNKLLEEELEAMRAAFPGVSFLPWRSEMTETTVVTVIPDDVIEEREFARAEMDLCKRMYTAYPCEVITFRSKDDEYFPYPADELANVTDYSGFWAEVLSKQAVCNRPMYEGFENKPLVFENTVFDINGDWQYLMIPKPMNSHTEEAFKQDEDSYYQFAA